MKKISLKIDDAFFPHFKALIESLVKDKKVQVIEEGYAYEKRVPEGAVAATVEEVQERVYDAEKQIESGEYDTEASYQNKMEDFFESYGKKE